MRQPIDCWIKIEKYQNGEYDPEIDKYSLEGEKVASGSRREDSSGGGEKANQKEDGGRKTKGEPRERAYEPETEYESSKAESEESETEETSEDSSEGDSGGED